MPELERLSTRRYEKGEQTRELILNTARRLFTRQGYHKTSVYDLFRHAAITKGAFYHHWKAKEDLALTIFRELERAYEEQIFSVLEAPGLARDKIQRTLQTLSVLNSKPDWLYCRLMATWTSELEPGQEGLGGAVHGMRQRWVHFWELLLEQAQAEGDLRCDIAPKELSSLMVSAICGVLLTQSDGQGFCQGMSRSLDTLRKILFTK